MAVDRSWTELSHNPRKVTLPHFDPTLAPGAGVTSAYCHGKALKLLAQLHLGSSECQASAAVYFCWEQSGFGCSPQHSNLPHPPLAPSPSRGIEGAARAAQASLLSHEQCGETLLALPGLQMNVRHHQSLLTNAEEIVAARISWVVLYEVLGSSLCPGTLGLPVPDALGAGAGGVAITVATAKSLVRKVKMQEPELVAKALRAVLHAFKNGVCLSELQNEYRSLTNELIPFRHLGYDTLEGYLKSIPGVVRMEENKMGEWHKTHWDTSYQWCALEAGAQELLSNMFMSGLDNGTEIILSKSVDDRRD
ncbi:hypothetical protein WISP_02173 [Willisornis vidua]|uniref:HTH OST-type domain-containing protein n=1 Tax=Willisornis vidua TaxID=1566151 RepID=A0ABQ9DUT3_9PASS|nr:hypothetical protein WISP_02173 [Willisornis vidua]